MTIGLGTYAFFWQWHDTAEQPLSAGRDDRPDTRPLGVERVPDLRLPAAGVLRRTIELGRRCSGHAGRPRRRDWSSAPAASGLIICAAISTSRGGSTPRCVRSMVNTGDHRPSLDEAVSAAAATVLPRYEAAGVTLALETYEQVPIADLGRHRRSASTRRRSASASTRPTASPPWRLPPATIDARRPVRAATCT